MTDETTPGAPFDPRAPLEPEAPVPSAEPEAPAYAGSIDVPEVVVEPEAAAMAAEPQVVEPEASAVATESEAVAAGEAEPWTPAPAPEPVPVAAPSVPPAGSALGPAIPSGSRVVVMVSRGPAPTPAVAYVTVPEVVGLAQGDALARLQQAGLPSQVFNDYHPKLPRGEVIGQLPPQGITVPAGSESVLMVSSGPSAAPAIPTPLPNVVGLPESGAVSLLQAAGLSPQLVREYSAGYPAGIAIAQIPNLSSLVNMPKKRSLAWLWIILALLVVIALGVGGYLYLNRTGIVPPLNGLTQAEAIAAIDAAGFKLGSIETTQTLKASDVGKVVGQSPAAKSEGRMTAGISILVSGGQKLLAVPTVTGKTQSEAEKVLKDAGFKSSVSKAFSTSVVKGIVISQAPEVGQKVPADTNIGIVVSEGAQNITVPSVTGASQSQATSTIKSLGLGVQVVSNHSATSKEGRVAEQYPVSASFVPPGTIMGLIISLGPSGSSETSVSVPSVVDKTSGDAETAIKAAGLKMVAVQWSGTGRPVNEVVAQIPESSVKMVKNESVIVFVSNGR